MKRQPVLELPRTIGEWRNPEQAIEVAVNNLVILGRNQDKLLLYIEHLRAEVHRLQKKISHLTSEPSAGEEENRESENEE